MYEEQVYNADNRQHRRILNVDNQVIADLRHNIADGLGQDDIFHGLHMGHTDGLGALHLTGIHRNDAAPDGFRHIGSRVNGYHQKRGGPHS